MIWVDADIIIVFGVDLENLWIIGVILIAVWVVVSVATETLLLDDNIREAVTRGIFGGRAFAVVYLFVRWRHGNDEL